jgi:hypothetical protein
MKSAQNMCCCIAPPSRDWLWKLFVGTTSGQIAVRCGGRSSARRTCVIPAYELPTVPTRPFDQPCAAIHSIVS